MTTSNSPQTVSLDALTTRSQAAKQLAHDQAVDASIARGFAQAQDVSCQKYALDEMRTRATRTIERRAKDLAHA